MNPDAPSTVSLDGLPEMLSAALARHLVQSALPPLFAWAIATPEQPSHVLRHTHVGEGCCVLTKRVPDDQIAYFAPVRYVSYAKVGGDQLIDVYYSGAHDEALRAHKRMISSAQQWMRVGRDSLLGETDLVDGTVVVTGRAHGFDEANGDAFYYTTSIHRLPGGNVSGGECLSQADYRSREAALDAHTEIVRRVGAAPHQLQYHRNLLRSVAAEADTVVEVPYGLHSDPTESTDHAATRTTATISVRFVSDEPPVAD